MLEMCDHIVPGGNHISKTIRIPTCSTCYIIRYTITTLLLHKALCDWNQ